MHGELLSFPPFFCRVSLGCESFHHEDHGPLWNSGYIIFRLPCDSHRGRVNCRFNRCVSFRNRLARSTIRNNYSFEGIDMNELDEIAFYVGRNEYFNS